jgi:adenosylhomocysteine nucleosidase
VKPIGIFAATRWELNAVLQTITPYTQQSVNGVRCWAGNRGPVSCRVIQSGVGPRNAEAAGRAILAGTPLSVLLSTGFTCALNDAEVGDVLVGSEVLGDPLPAGHAPLACAAQWMTRAVRASHETGIATIAGRFVCRSRVLSRAEEKRALAVASGAIGVDMESAALAMVARDAAVPFVIVRAVSDRRDEDLPLDFNLFLRPTGWIAGTIACLSHPSSLAGLSRLWTQSRIAAAHLTRFYERYLDALCDKEDVGAEAPAESLHEHSP